VCGGGGTGLVGDEDWSILGVLLLPTTNNNNTINTIIIITTIIVQYSYRS